MSCASSASRQNLAGCFHGTSPLISMPSANWLNTIPLRLGSFSIIRVMLWRLFFNTIERDSYSSFFFQVSSPSVKQKSVSAACCFFSRISILTVSSLLAKSAIARNDFFSSSSPKRWMRTMSKALHSFRYAGSLAWWLYTNLPPSLISTPG